MHKNCSFKGQEFAKARGGFGVLRSAVASICGRLSGAGGARVASL